LVFKSLVFLAIQTHQFQQVRETFWCRLYSTVSEH